MNASYTQTTNSSDGAFCVAYRNTVNDAWGVDATTHQTEAAATLAAIAKVEAGAYQARVCPPVGVLFTHSA